MKKFDREFIKAFDEGDAFSEFSLLWFYPEASGAWYEVRVIGDEEKGKMLKELERQRRLFEEDVKRSRDVLGKSGVAEELAEEVEAR